MTLTPEQQPTVAAKEVEIDSLKLDPNLKTHQKVLDALAAIEGGKVLIEHFGILDGKSKLSPEEAKRSNKLDENLTKVAEGKISMADLVSGMAPAKEGVSNPDVDAGLRALMKRKKADH